MKKIQLTIFDETLRDGEQQVGIFFDTEIKQTLAHLIAETGIPHLALMPAIHHTEAELVKSLITQGFAKKIVASTMMEKHYIDESQACGATTVILFNAVSDRLLWLRDPEFREQTREKQTHPQAIAQVRQRMLDKVVAHLKYAKAQGLKICFAAEDASRADSDFLVECIIKFQPYIENFLLCDTVGILTPEHTKFWLRNILELTAHKIPLAVHFHNDHGLALENTIQAVLAGATGISGTFGGIGERAGNVAIEQVLNGLKLRYGWQVEGINYDALAEVVSYLNNQGFRANTPYCSEVLRCETGIHVDSLLRDRDTYYLFPHGEPEVWFGKFSGASNFQYLFENKLQRSLPKKKYQEFREIIKDLSIKHKRSFSGDEVLNLLVAHQVNYDR
ncbi:isopropylmalate/homocitrate/citramalate synthase [Xenococcus sp. PCC 7305]|uniref:LeuA family protein n=1 Tax=Xenococcus sp. PCC 7305 TaxID=102125 RepID=UPI0002ACC99B|nr:isopropylmalate/homocitrate/citramalate synthase [Xenococcus sp. PCC 7305]ELS03505.1 isopropylmalate/homocitrate/citramalate synthase [Xenococcus sp. PCC 7305]